MLYDPFALEIGPHYYNSLLGLVLHSAEEALEKYLEDNQEKTDDILRRFARLLGPVISSKA